MEFRFCWSSFTRNEVAENVLETRLLATAVVIYKRVQSMQDLLVMAELEESIGAHFSDLIMYDIVICDDTQDKVLWTRTRVSH